MKKKIALFLLVCIVFAFCSCSLIKNPIAEEYSKESYISIENRVPKRVSSVSITPYFAERAYLSEEIIDSHSKKGKENIQTFCIRREDILKEDEAKSFSVRLTDDDLKSYSIKVSVIQTDGSEIIIEKAIFPLEFGTDYSFVLNYENGSYVIS